MYLVSFAQSHNAAIYEADIHLISIFTASMTSDHTHREPEIYNEYDCILLCLDSEPQRYVTISHLRKASLQVPLKAQTAHTSHPQTCQ